MRKFLLLFPGFLLLQITATKAQKDSLKTGTENSVNLGIGLGIDYGGFGFRLNVVPERAGFLFLGLGYNTLSAGINAGAGYLFAPKKKVCPYADVMYGYNAVIVIENASRYDRTYYGITFGIGIELHNKSNRNFWNLGLLFPIRSTEYEDDLRAIKNNPNIRIETEPPPFGISAGYHFGL
jgi:hypothetical protein